MKKIFIIIKKNLLLLLILLPIFINKTNNFIKTTEETNINKNEESDIFEDLKFKNKLELISLFKRHFIKSNIKNKLYIFKKDLIKFKNIKTFTSIQSLGNNKYFLGTAEKGFYLLIFKNSSNIFELSRIKHSRNLIYENEDLIKSNNIAKFSSIQSLGNNKYLVGTNNKGFYLLKFDDDTNLFEISKIKDNKENKILDLRTDKAGRSSSIQLLGKNKYLVGTNNNGFYLLKFHDDTNLFIISKIKDNLRNKISDLTTDKVGCFSSIQSLGNNKYLVGTYNKGFYLLKFNNPNNSFTGSKIKDESEYIVWNLTNGKVGEGSSIQFLGNNKYLVGTNDKGFYLLKFDNDTNLFTASKIKDENNQEILGLTSNNISKYSSIQSLGNNKYLVGTYNKGFYLLKFNNNNTFTIKNIIKKEFYIKNIFFQRFLNEISRFWENNDYFWKDFFDIFDKNDDEQVISIKENADFDNFNKIKLIKLIKSIVIFNFKNTFNKIFVEFKDEHKNIIRLTKWLLIQKFINKTEFNNLLGITNENPFNNKLFEQDFSIKKELTDIFLFSEYYDINVWLKNILLTKKNNVIEKIKEVLTIYFNENKIRKKIAKLIIETKVIPDNFFSDTGLTKESFEINLNKKVFIKVNAFWNVELNTRIYILNNYKFWIDSLDEKKYKELLKYRINELLTTWKKELILDAKKINGKEDEVLEIINFSVSHTDFNDDGSLTDNLSIEKLEIIKKWLTSLKESEIKNIYKNIIKNKLNNNHKNIIKLVKWLEMKIWLNDNEFNNLLGIKDENPITSELFDTNGNISTILFDDITENKYNVIKKWLGDTIKNIDELIDKENNVIEITKEKLILYFNNYEIRKDIVKILLKLTRIPDFFFKDNFEENGINIGLSKNSFNSINGLMKEFASWNINLSTFKIDLEKYKIWIDSLDEKKYLELLKYRINELLEENENQKKNLIIEIKSKSSVIDELLEFDDKLKNILDNHFGIDGSLRDDLNKKTLEIIKKLLISLSQPKLKNIYKKIIKKNLNKKHKNIIRLAKWLKNKNQNFQFNNFLKILEHNPLTNDSFDDFGNIKEANFDSFFLNKYYIIKDWLDITENTDELIDKEIEVIQKIKKELSNYLNEKKTKKDIVKLIFKLNIIPDNFFKYNFEENWIDIGLIKEDIQLSDDGIDQIKIDIFWDITLDISNINLDNYKFWIESLNEEKYKELLKFRINELLEENKNEKMNLIKNAKLNTSNINKILRINENSGFSHTDFKDNGLLKEVTKINKTKLEVIKIWLNKLKIKTNNIVFHILLVSIIPIILLILIIYFVVKIKKYKKIKKTNKNKKKIKFKIK